MRERSRRLRRGAPRHALGALLAALALGSPVLLGVTDAASAKPSRAHRRVHRPAPPELADVQSPSPDPRTVPTGLLGFDLGVLGAGIAGASTALPPTPYPPGYGFYGPDYHGPGFGYPGY